MEILVMTIPPATMRFGKLVYSPEVLKFHLDEAGAAQIENTLKTTLDSQTPGKLSPIVGLERLGIDVKVGIHSSKSATGVLKLVTLQLMRQSGEAINQAAQMIPLASFTPENLVNTFSNLLQAPIAMLVEAQAQAARQINPDSSES
jgi:hypothetical protein